MTLVPQSETIRKRFCRAAGRTRALAVIAMLSATLGCFDHDAPEGPIFTDNPGGPLFPSDPTMQDTTTLVAALASVPPSRVYGRVLLLPAGYSQGATIWVRLDGLSEHHSYSAALRTGGCDVDGAPVQDLGVLTSGDPVPERPDRADSKIVASSPSYWDSAHHVIVRDISDPDAVIVVACALLRGGTRASPSPLRTG